MSAISKTQAGTSVSLLRVTGTVYRFGEKHSTPHSCLEGIILTWNFVLVVRVGEADRHLIAGLNNEIDSLNNPMDELYQSLRNYCLDLWFS